MLLPAPRSPGRPASGAGAGAAAAGGGVVGPYKSGGGGGGPAHSVPLAGDCSDRAAPAGGCPRQGPLSSSATAQVSPPDRCEDAAAPESHGPALGDGGVVVCPRELRANVGRVRGPAGRAHRCGARAASAARPRRAKAALAGPRAVLTAAPSASRKLLAALRPRFGKLERVVHRAPHRQGGRRAGDGHLQPLPGSEGGQSTLPSLACLRGPGARPSAPPRAERGVELGGFGRRSSWSRGRSGHRPRVEQGCPSPRLSRAEGGYPKVLWDSLCSTGTRCAAERFGLVTGGRCSPLGNFLGRRAL